MKKLILFVSLVLLVCGSLSTSAFARKSVAIKKAPIKAQVKDLKIKKFSFKPRDLSRISKTKKAVKVVSLVRNGINYDIFVSGSGKKGTCVVKGSDKSSSSCSAKLKKSRGIKGLNISGVKGIKDLEGKIDIGVAAGAGSLNAGSACVCLSDKKWFCDPTSDSKHGKSC